MDLLTFFTLEGNLAEEVISLRKIQWGDHYIDKEGNLWIVMLLAPSNSFYLSRENKYGDLFTEKEKPNWIWDSTNHYWYEPL